ncbi:MAG: alpha/beta hydrolase [Gemmatimonadetes bacterium]|nr:alpha/beta hydrolase [Gemmatimonadota bacterium]
MATFLIVHGMWSGGWIFQPTARLLRAAGHEVYTPSLTGVGERVHLGSPDTDLDTHVQDIVNVLVFEDLAEVVLVGYSYGGAVITAVAERAAERISQLVYLDAWIPRDGEAVFDLIPEQAPRFEEAARREGDGWRVPRDPPHPRKTPHPLATLKEPLSLSSEAAARLPRSYVLFSRNSLYHAPVMAEMAARGRAAGWRVLYLPADHDAPETHAPELARLLAELV